MDFLATIKAPSPVFPNDHNTIVTVAEDASVSEAFQALINNNVLSAPVFNYDLNKYCNMFSMRDVVHHALHILDETEFTTEDMPAITFLTEKDHFRKYKVKDVIGKKEKLVEVDSETTVDNIVRMMVNCNVHRAVSVNPADHSLSNIITQSRVVECLSQLFAVSPSLGRLGKQTVLSLHLASVDTIFSAKDTDKAIDAFRLMCEHNISGLPVVDENNRLVGNISESDLRVIKSDAQYLKMLFQPVREYLTALHKVEQQLPRARKTRALVTCKMTDTYKTVVEKVTEARVHRCFVVDDNGALTGVVSLHNILSALVNFPAAP